MALVILGGGIIGLSVAYYSSLAQTDRKIIIIDNNTELLQSASGFSGGYIVRDWFSTDVLPLADLSYLLHKQLADSNHGRKLWGYSESIAYSLAMEDADNTGKRVRGEDWLLTGTSRAEVAKKYVSTSRAKLQPDKRDTLLRSDGSPGWANIPEGGKLEQISSPDGCAQLEPRHLCEWLLAQCQARNVQVVLDTEAINLIQDRSGRVAGLLLESGPSRQVSVLPCKDIVIAAGCWTPRVYQRLVRRKMEIGVKPLPGYSIVVRSPRYNRPIDQIEVSGTISQISHAVFYPPCSTWTYSPEAMARMTRDGRPEIFVAGLNDEAIVLPHRASHTKNIIDPRKVADLKSTALALAGRTTSSGFDDDLEVVREGLCFRPVSESGIPIISKVRGVESTYPAGGMYVAAGHGPWGVSLSLATGLVMSEMLQGVETSVPVAAFALPEYTSPVSARL